MTENYWGDLLKETVEKKTPKLYEIEKNKQNEEFVDSIDFKKFKDFNVDKYLGLTIKGMFLLKNENSVYAYVSCDAGKDYDVIKEQIPEEDIKSWRIYFKELMYENEFEEYYGNLLKEIELEYL